MEHAGHLEALAGIGEQHGCEFLFHALVPAQYYFKEICQHPAHEEHWWFREAH